MEGVPMRNKSVRILVGLMFIVYISLLIRFVVFKFPFHMIQEIFQTWSIDTMLRSFERGNYIPLQTIKLYMRAYEQNTLSKTIIYYNIIGNIVAFIPLGFLPYLCRRKVRTSYVFMGSLLFILSIELFQGITNIGSFDIDDVLLNMLGVIIGIFLYYLTRGILGIKR